MMTASSSTASASSSSLCWWKDTATSTNDDPTTCYYPARYYPDSTAAVTASAHIPELRHQALMMKTEELVGKKEATPIVLVFLTTRTVYFSRYCESSVDREFHQRWCHVLKELEHHKEQTGTIQREAAEAIQTALTFESIKETTTEINTGGERSSPKETVVPNHGGRGVSIREHDSSEDEEEPDDTHMVEMEDDDDQDDLSIDEDSEDEEEEKVVEFSNDAPITHVWHLHEDARWYKKRINGQESHYMRPNGRDGFTSLEDFLERHVRVRYPEWTGPRPHAVATPQPSFERQQRVVTATHKKPERSCRRRTAPKNLLGAAPTPFPWHTLPELLTDAEIVKILATLGVKVIKNKQAQKKPQYILPGISVKHGFRSLSGVQQFLRDHGLPRATDRTKPVGRKKSSNLALWINCANIHDDTQLLNDLRTSEPLKKDEQLQIRLQRVHGFFAEGERLYVPNFRDIPRTDAEWEEGKHFYHSTYDLHTRVRALVRNDEDMLRKDPQLRRWCCANHDLPPAPPDTALTDAVLTEYTSILPVDVDSSDDDPEFKSNAEHRISTTEKKPRDAAKKQKTKVKHWWATHEFPSFNKEIQPLLLKMGCKQCDGKWILPWWPQQAFSVESVAAMCRVHVEEDAASKLNVEEQEILRRWVMFSILGSSTRLLREISSPVKSTAGRADLFRSAGWLQEPERLFVPGYQDIDRPGADFVYGSHFFSRDCDDVYKPSEERKIRAYIRQHPKAAGELPELLKWAANDSTAKLPVHKEMTIDQTVSLLEISLREGPTEPQPATTTSVFSLQDIVGAAERGSAWSGDVEEIMQGIGISKNRGFYVHEQVPNITWRSPEDVAKYFVEHGVPDLGVLDNEDAKTIEHWVRFCYVPDQSLHQMRLADRLLCVTTFQKLFEKAGVSKFAERLLSDPCINETEQLRHRICATERLGSLDDAEEPTRRGRRANVQCQMNNKEKDLYMLALRLWAANSTAPLPLLEKDTAVRSPRAPKGQHLSDFVEADLGPRGDAVEQNGEPMSTENEALSAIDHHECTVEGKPRAKTEGAVTVLAESTRHNDISEPVPPQDANGPCDTQSMGGTLCPESRALLSDQYNTPRTANTSVARDEDDVAMLISKPPDDNQFCSPKRQCDHVEKAITGNKKHKPATLSFDSPTMNNHPIDDGSPDATRSPILYSQEEDFGIGGFLSL